MGKIGDILLLTQSQELISLSDVALVKLFLASSIWQKNKIG